MDEIAAMLAQADTARTAPDAPVPPEADALLREILATPRRPENQHRKADRVPASHWPKHLTLLAGAGTIVLIVGLLIFNIWKPAENPGTFTISHSAPPTADYPWYATEDDLIAASDAILRGEVLDEREEQLDGLDYTVVTVKVDTVAEGPLKPDEQVDVKYPSLTEPVPVGLGPGDHVVLFLALFPGAPASLVSPAQGSYFLAEDNTIQTSVENPIRLSENLLAQLGVIG